MKRRTKNRVKKFLCSSEYFEKHPIALYIMGLITGATPLIFIFLILISHGLNPSDVISTSYLVSESNQLSKFVNTSRYIDVALNWSEEAKAKYSGLEVSEGYEKEMIAIHIYSKLRNDVLMEIHNKTAIVLHDVNNNGKVNCEDISVMMCSLLGALDIPCKIALTDNNDDDTGHAFNVVFVNGKWVMVDVSMGTPWGSALVKNNTVILS